MRSCHNVSVETGNLKPWSKATVNSGDTQGLRDSGRGGWWVSVSPNQEDTEMGEQDEMGESTANVHDDIPKQRERSVYEQRIDHINRVVEQIDKERVLIVSRLQPILGPSPGAEESHDKEAKPGDHIPSPLESQLDGTAKHVAELLVDFRMLQKRIVM